MRQITITRRKSLAGCLAPFKLYVADALGDTTIGGEKCRLVANVGNGETVTFEIDENATRIYAIADKLSKGYCVDCYPVEEGNSDLTLSGVCKFNPFAGNPFLFDGVTAPEILEKRKQIKRKTLIFGSIFLVAYVVIGFAIGVAWAILI